MGLTFMFELLNDGLAEEVQKVRTRMEEIDQWTEEQHAENRKKIAEAVDVVIGKILSR